MVVFEGFEKVAIFFGRISSFEDRPSMTWVIFSGYPTPSWGRQAGKESAGRRACVLKRRANKNSRRRARVAGCSRGPTTRSR